MWAALDGRLRCEVQEVEVEGQLDGVLPVSLREKSDPVDYPYEHSSLPKKKECS